MIYKQIVNYLTNGLNFRFFLLYNEASENGIIRYIKIRRFVLSANRYTYSIYYGKDAIEELKNLTGKKAFIVVGGGSMKRFGFLDKVEQNLKAAGMETYLFEGVEPDPSVETVMKGAAAMREFEPDWIVSIGGGSPIDAAKAMWVFYEYPDAKFEDLITPFSFPTLRTKAKFLAIRPPPVRQQKLRHFLLLQTIRRGLNIRLLISILRRMWQLLILHWRKPCAEAGGTHRYGCADTRD